MHKSSFWAKILKIGGNSQKIAIFRVFIVFEAIIIGSYRVFVVLYGFVELLDENLDFLALFWSKMAKNRVGGATYHCLGYLESFFSFLTTTNRFGTAENPENH